ncbi:MAG: hypothetical protein KDM64_12080, partial [Verrucomicrobiae bacterium]|nr:hypothetical protein [Verrucomicrobiae bacterium]
FTAFMIEAWLGAVICETVAEYADHKAANQRTLQNGRARRLFEEHFQTQSPEDTLHLFDSLTRFTEYDDCQSRQVFRAFANLNLESLMTDRPKPAPTPEALRKGLEWMQTVFSRLCDWVEADIHATTHLMAQVNPVAFDPDPEKRELAILGINQRQFPGLTDFEKQWWTWHHGEASERLTDPAKWSMVARAAASPNEPLHHYPALDNCVIRLWPLMTCHNWTYHDLMRIVQRIAPKPLGYPCREAKEFSTYCRNVLGLKKGGTGKSTVGRWPPGARIAFALCGIDRQD